VTNNKLFAGLVMHHDVGFFARKAKEKRRRYDGVEFLWSMTSVIIR
jgi:hypothetical protein